MNCVLKKKEGNEIFYQASRGGTIRFVASHADG